MAASPASQYSVGSFPPITLIGFHLTLLDLAQQIISGHNKQSMSRELIAKINQTPQFFWMHQYF